MFACGHRQTVARMCFILLIVSSTTCQASTPGIDIANGNVTSYQQRHQGLQASAHDATDPQRNLPMAWHNEKDGVHHHVVKRATSWNMRAAEFVTSDYYWRDPQADDDSHHCNQGKFLQIYPGLPHEKGVDVELELRFKPNSNMVYQDVIQVADSPNCIARGYCSPFTGFRIYRSMSQISAIVFPRSSQPFTRIKRDLVNGTYMISFGENTITIVTNGELWHTFKNKQMFQFPLSQHALYVGINRNVAPPWKGVNRRGADVCSAKITWSRVVKQASELVSGDYEWSDTRADQPGGCKMQNVLTLKPSRDDVSGVVMQMRIKKVGDYMFHIGGAYWNDGFGGGDGAAEIFYAFRKLLVFGRDGVPYATVLQPFTPGTVTVTLKTNSIQMKMGDKMILDLEQVPMYVFPILTDGLYVGINRAISTRNRRVPLRGLCSIKVTWLTSPVTTTTPGPGPTPARTPHKPPAGPPHKPPAGPTQKSPPAGPPAQPPAGPPAQPPAAEQQPVLPPDAAATTPAPNPIRPPHLQPAQAPPGEISHRLDNSVVVLGLAGGGGLLLLVYLLCCRKKEQPAVAAPAAQEMTYYGPQNTAQYGGEQDYYYQ